MLVRIKDPFKHIRREKVKHTWVAEEIGYFILPLHPWKKPTRKPDLCFNYHPIIEDRNKLKEFIPFNFRNQIDPIVRDTSTRAKENKIADQKMKKCFQFRNFQLYSVEVGSTCSIKCSYFSSSFQIAKHFHVLKGPWSKLRENILGKGDPLFRNSFKIIKKRKLLIFVFIQVSRHIFWIVYILVYLRKIWVYSD